MLRFHGLCSGFSFQLSLPSPTGLIDRPARASISHSSITKLLRLLEPSESFWNLPWPLGFRLISSGLLCLLNLLSLPFSFYLIHNSPLIKLLPTAASQKFSCFSASPLYHFLSLLLFSSSLLVSYYFAEKVRIIQKLPLPPQALLPPVKDHPTYKPPVTKVEGATHPDTHTPV